ncbi:uncharacterized protein LOC110735395 [Chenopodium quinoa]|uniref:uncharacterized protein LOC110735395 n=1 Tax=Chenopodium quinoa TaxID=63459 RepID=UPI000B795704|nr:uncharacterized protein LOC110735395 [Chenopodium quinoa]
MEISPIQNPKSTQNSPIEVEPPQSAVTSKQPPKEHQKEVVVKRGSKERKIEEVEMVVVEGDKWSKLGETCTGMALMARNAILLESTRFIPGFCVNLGWCNAKRGTRNQKMARIANRDFEIIDISGGRYLEWRVDAKAYLRAQSLEHAIAEEGNPTPLEQAKALVYIDKLKMSIFSLRILENFRFSSKTDSNTYRE